MGLFWVFFHIHVRVNRTLVIISCYLFPDFYFQKWAEHPRNDSGHPHRNGVGQRGRAKVRSESSCLEPEAAASYQPNGRGQWQINAHWLFSPPTQGPADQWGPGVTDLQERKSPHLSQQSRSPRRGRSVSLWHFQAWAWCLPFGIFLRIW